MRSGKSAAILRPLDGKQSVRPSMLPRRLARMRLILSSHRYNPGSMALKRSSTQFGKKLHGTTPELARAARSSDGRFLLSPFNCPYRAGRPAEVQYVSTVSGLEAPLCGKNSETTR